MRVVIKFIILLSVFICHNSCGSIPKPIPAELPASLLSRFSSCDNLDGSFQMSLRRANLSILTVDVDWVSQDNSSWILESVSSFGSTLFRLEYDRSSKSFQSIGAIAGQFDIKVHENGNLVIDGLEIAIKPEEIPCLLKRLWPQNWLFEIYQFDPDEIAEQWNYIVQNKHRSILLAFDKPYESITASRVQITWSSFFGFVKRRIYAQISGNELKITGYKDYELSLNDLDSQ